MNRKGLIGVQIAMLGIAFCMIVAGVTLRPSHIINRANQKCVALEDTVENCKARVSAMSQKERIEYIRDTVESPSSAWMK